MPITEQDIKLLKSARMADTPDGGGRMTGEVVTSGVDNNIFDDVSNLDRVYGNVSLRKVFPAVLTNTTDKYLGSRIIIDEPPADPNIHGLLFDASSLFDTREQARIKVEGYMSRGVASFYYLFGDHIAGQGALMLASVESMESPSIGAVLVLRAETAKDSGVFNEQFVRVTTATSTVAEFTGADGKKIRLRLSTCDISDPLRYDFQGWGPLEDGMVTSDKLAETANATRTMVHSSVVADAAQYFGIRPLATAASSGAFSIKADSVYSALVPSAQIETPLSYLPPYTARGLPVPAHDLITYSTVTHDWTPTIALNLPGGCLPGSLSIVTAGITVTDAAGKLMSVGSQIGTIDYTNGVLSLSTGSLSGSKDITYTPAAHVLRAPQSTEIPVTIESRSQFYVGTVLSIPQPGTLSVSYMVGGLWYTLSDGGDGALRGALAGHGAGTFNPLTGAYVVTLGALPDVGSSVVITWGVPTQETAHPSVALKAAQPVQLVVTSGQSVQPGSMTITWPLDGVTQTATVAVDGTISGAATGKLYPSTNAILFEPNLLPAVGTQCTVACTVGPKQEDNFAHPSRDGAGKVPVTASIGAIVPGSLEVEWNTFTETAVLGSV